MIELYPFQQQVVDDLRRGLMAGPPSPAPRPGHGWRQDRGGLAPDPAAAKAGKRSMFIVDRIELVDQAARHLDAIGLKVGRCPPGKCEARGG